MNLIQEFVLAEVITKILLLNENLTNICVENKTCAGGNDFDCNCDSGASKWLSDESTYKSTKNLGITEMFFMQQSTLDTDSQGRITLGPLECVEASEYTKSQFIDAILTFLHFFCRHPEVRGYVYFDAIVHRGARLALWGFGIQL